MLLHVDWVDLCGKSTLIDKINRLFKNVVIFKTPKEYLPREDSKEAREKIWNYYYKRAEEAYETLKKNPNQIILLDRFFLSELVYWQVIRGYDSSDVKPLMTKLINLLQKIDQEYGYGIIYLSDSTESIWKRFQIHGDDYIQDKKYFHNLKGEFSKRINGLNNVFKILEINVFKDNDYWNKIIEELLLFNYIYIRQ